jgi:hypothetical protein
MTPLKEFEVIPINCIWTEPDNLVRLLKQMEDQDEDRYWQHYRQQLALKSVYFPAPPIGGSHLPKFSVWQPGNMSFGSVFVPNYRDEMIQLMRHLNRRFHIRYFSAHLSRDHKKEGICRFEHADEAEAQRVVHVILDRAWEFHEQGEVLPFENKSYYQRCRIAERLTPTIVIEYLKALGWNLEDEGFWKSKGEAWVSEKTKFE